jgi:hypothetical protein
MKGFDMCVKRRAFAYTTTIFILHLDRCIHCLTILIL